MNFSRMAKVASNNPVTISETDRPFELKFIELQELEPQCM